MASEHDHNAVYNDDEDDDDEPLNDVVLDEDEDEEDSSDTDDADTNSTSSAVAVSVALLPPSNGSNPPPVVHSLFASTPPAAVAPLAATPVSERKPPIEDSRRLFQRLWTDEDEIELLQGFLDYTARRGPNWSGHHHDTTAFYDQIKSKIQLDCNKNQLVEKLRRLKKKYRTAVARIGAGKEFVFKTPHDQATFEISRKIWSNLIASRPEFDEDDQMANPSSVVTPVNLNLNIASDHRTTPSSFSIDMNSSDKVSMMMNMGTPISRSRKRPRVKMEEEIPRNVNSARYEPVNLAPVQRLMEENVKSSLSELSPLLKELVDNAVGGSGSGNGFGSRGIGSLAFNASPMNFPGANLGNGGGVMEERWRRQQILELEVYSKRLELVQDQIKLALVELRTRN